MSNEKILEEIYYEVHMSGLINEFHNKISEMLKTNNKLTMYDIVFYVYHDFKNKGLLNNVVTTN